jgi:hypothetical protein
MKTCLLVLAFAVVTFGQETASLFKCPDGTLVPSEVKGRPYRCPDTDQQREANAYFVQTGVWAKESTDRVKKASEEWQKEFDAEHERNQDELKKILAKNWPTVTEAVVKNQIAAHIRLVGFTKQKADHETTMSGLARETKIQAINDDRLRETALESNQAVTNAEIRLVDATIDQIALKEELSLDSAKRQVEGQLKTIADRAKAAERAKATPACHAVYVSTIDKPTGQLTVRETQQISECRNVGLYK